MMRRVGVVDVVVHRYGVGGEQLCVGWRIQGGNEILEFLGTGYVGMLIFSYYL